MKGFFWGGPAAVREACLKTAAIALLILCANAAADSARPETSQAVTAELSNIAYLSGSEYLVEVSIANATSGPIDLSRSDFHFSAQSDVLGQWIDLGWRRDAGLQRDSRALLPGEERGTGVIVTLPVSLRHLYRNHEGDVNMRFQYTFMCPNGASPTGQKCTGESAYWVTPETSRWVLREGM